VPWPDDLAGPRGGLGWDGRPVRGSVDWAGARIGGRRLAGVRGGLATTCSGRFALGASEAGVGELEGCGVGDRVVGRGQVGLSVGAGWLGVCLVRSG
jgi:hypothetical protein